MKIMNFEDFVSGLIQVGFSMDGGNSEDIFSLVSWSWNEQAPYETPVVWHTGDPETDPWEWRMRVLDERDDIAYAKLFFKKSGYITREWYPYFLAARRGNTTFEEAYEGGKFSQYAKKIYETIVAYESIPLHGIKQLCGFDKTDQAQFEKAMIELQMNMFITMCGRQRKKSRYGEEYGWSSTVFCTVEEYFGTEIMEEASHIDSQKAIEKITQQILMINPEAKQKKITKFIIGY